MDRWIWRIWWVLLVLNILSLGWYIKTYPIDYVEEILFPPTAYRSWPI
jgi:hypothetical protein